jgi:hypothetical protein
MEPGPEHPRRPRHPRRITRMLPSRPSPALGDGAPFPAPGPLLWPPAQPPAWPLPWAPNRLGGRRRAQPGPCLGCPVP